MISHFLRVAVVFLAAATLARAQLARAQGAKIPPAKAQVPHGQDRPPGPALSPAEAIRKMQVPPGFQVELVAAEPDIVNPVSMTFDERGRIWITESLEYPRKSAGPGRDRVKLLEDTDGDGRVDKVTVFADGLNIPSGIAVGYGGVWVADAPDILFLQDTDGDGKADRREVVATGFGRHDTHELPNSLTWGPDGWLYGLNGVFNTSQVRSGGKDYKFTCAMFRIHPRTREFQIFCEGTSNPWGIAWDDTGSAFVSACVVDHLWHLSETGYYHRQGGPYPPFTWQIGSIARHKHQKAAYCGIHYFDSDAYPAEYRRHLYMGNIHGGCINVDDVARDGATYSSSPRPDFLTANDAWFMPVSQKTGPDGSLYILDWYDRYHCYQDAGRDPQGIDRLKGRLYRVRYKETPRVWGFDLSKKTDDELLATLEHAPNDYFRSTIVRLLSERHNEETRPKLERLALDEKAPLKVRMRALWALIGGGPLDDAFHRMLLSNREPAFRAWGVRAAGNMGHVSESVRQSIIATAHDPVADVRMQAAIASRKLDGVDPAPVLVDVLAHSGDDPLIPHIVWNNLQPLLDEHGGQIAHQLAAAGLEKNASFGELVPRTFERLLAARQIDGGALRELFALSLHAERPEAARRCLQMLVRGVQDRELAGDRLRAVQSALRPSLPSLLNGDQRRPLFFEVALLAATWRETAGLKVLRGMVLVSSISDARRIAAFEALIAGGDPAVLEEAESILATPRKSSPRLRGRVLAALGRLDDARVAEIVLANYGRMEPTLQPAAVELLTQRLGWSKRLLAAVAAGQIPPGALNLSQVRKLLAFRDAELAKQVRSKWGTIRDQRSPQREAVIARMRKLIRSSHGDAAEGERVYKKLCAQCHKIHGEGADVGPEITLNGRSSLELLLSNVFDPNLVIGAAYRAVTVVTKEGRVFTGLPVEDSANRIVLKVQGGKTETIPRGDVESSKTSDISLMPEQVENQLKPQEIVDLFTFLSYDKHPSDPGARRLSGFR